MTRSRIMLAQVACAAITLFTTPAQAHPLLVLSIDGLRPDDVAQAEQRGLAVPNLRRLLAEGTHAAGVRGVLPTFTLPSHATLLTGVSPAHHGVTNNLTFNPANAGAAAGYQLAGSLKAPTLWDAARARGLVTASVNWPTSLGSRSIDANVSNFFVSPGTTQDDAQYNRLLSTPGLIDELERAIGPIVLAPRHDAAGEEQDVRIAEAVLKSRRPGLITVHLAAVDEAQHKFGPGSAEAKTAIEAIDGYVGRLVATARAVQPDTVVAIVSDHGFTAVTREVNLPRAFVDAGLASLDAQGRLASWDAIPWAAGGSAAIILARPDDAALKTRVAALLDKLKADPALGIEEVYGKEELVRRGGFPEASFGLAYRLDTTGPAARPLTNPLVAPAVQKGTHGHAASHPGLYATFIVAGPGIAKGRDLGVIDMRAIAPTLARIIEAPFPSAEVAPVSIQEVQAR